MRRHSLYIGALAAVLLATVGAAEARMHAPYRGHRILPSGGVVDGIASAPLEAYSFRKVKQSYAGPLVKLRRASDNGLLDIPATAGGDLDTTVAATHCAATTCYLNTVYDQSGGNRHLVQATLTAQPLYVASCTGGHPCMRLDADDYMQSSVSASASTGVMTLAGVAKRTSGTGSVSILSPAGGGNLSFYTSAGSIMLYSGAALTGAAAENAWHSAIGVLNGASSNLNVDGNQFPGALTTPISSGLPVMGSAAGTSFDWAEAMAWNNYVLTAAEQVALIQNQRDYWLPLPLDTFATPAGAYSFRKLKSTYAGPAIRIRRASDNAETDINFLGYVPGLGSPVDTAAANAHCAATSCFVKTIYDQSGNARDLAQLTAAAQPSLIFNCSGTLPCVQFPTAGTQYIQGPTAAAPTGAITLNVVANRVSGIGSCFLINQNVGGGANRIMGTAGANAWSLANNTFGSFGAAATDGAWHAAIGVMNGASSLLRIDGTETAGSLAISTGAGGHYISGAAGTVCNVVEGVIWNNYGVPPAERAVLQQNQKSFWGTP